MAHAERRTIYLANPYGFSEQQKTRLLPEIVAALVALGLDVWEPFERNNQVDLSEPGWAYRIAQADFKDVREADAIFAVVNGTPPDEGVMIELGMAIAMGKPTFLFRGRFPSGYRQRGISLEPYAFRRNARSGVARLLLYVCR